MSDKSVTVQPQQTTLADLQRMATSAAKSGLFGIKDPEQALSLLLIAQAEGRHPMLAVRDYHLIQNRPALKADTMLARFQAAGGRVDWKEYTDTKCVGVFSHPQAGSVEVEWTIERAQKIGLAGRDNWKNYPRAMLRARCISEGVRTCYPGIAVGVYTPEEIEDGAHEIDITPPQTKGAVDAATTQAVRDVSTALTPEEIDAHINAMDVRTLPELKTAFGAAWTHAKQANDKAAQTRFKQVYDLAVEGLARNDMEHTI
jgi:hypothetical protein